MDLADVNIYINAFRSDLPEHSLCRDWLEDTIAGESKFGVSPLALSALVRIVTHPRIFKNPNTTKEALAFADALLVQPNCVLVNPGDRHWALFSRLCAKGSVLGNLIPDAYYAAIAIEHSCRWVTMDRDFEKFEGLALKVLKN